MGRASLRKTELEGSRRAHVDRHAFDAHDRWLGRWCGVRLLDEADPHAIGVFELDLIVGIGPLERDLLALEARGPWPSEPAGTPRVVRSISGGAVKSPLHGRVRESGTPGPSGSMSSHSDLAGENVGQVP